MDEGLGSMDEARIPADEPLNCGDELFRRGDDGGNC